MDLDIIWLDGRYKLQRRVGTGLFGELNAVMLCPLLTTHKHAGEIYLACDILLGQPIIIKLEPLNSNHQTLEHKFYVYCKLRGGVGIPEVHWFGSECTRWPWIHLVIHSRTSLFNVSFNSALKPPYS
jgi:hypothetical protein